jgi:cold shock protein
LRFTGLFLAFSQEQGLPMEGNVAMSDQLAAQIAGVEGVVKWFDPKKGFGFIIGPEGQDIFVHFSAIEGNGFRVLKDGARVLYDAVRSDKGWKATRAVKPDSEVKVTAGARKGYSRSPRR